MGLVLSDNGIGPAEDKVKAIVDAREPQSASEVRSFLGLANYNEKLKTTMLVSFRTLRQSQKGCSFRVWRRAEERINELKRRLSSAETLGYFDKDAKTLIIADASPVGLSASLFKSSKAGKE